MIKATKIAKSEMVRLKVTTTTTATTTAAFNRQYAFYTYAQSLNIKHARTGGKNVDWQVHAC